MFKSLLNTLPVLSGNFTLACKLNDISKQSKGKFVSYIYEASIKPLDENIKIYKSVPVNLMNGKYSFDIKKYTSIIDIHKNVWKNNYTTFIDLDRTTPVDDHNKIYEYGCKRISYELNKNEWSFYAPFYINNFEDIPDYFIIEINKKDSTQVLKQIKVYIGKKKNENKLYYYLKRHIEQIENNIPITWQYNNKEIIIHNAIDYRNGVIMSRLIDSNSQILYSNHVTINEFDSMLNNLYYDNGFILSEVIPISFEFTLSDFLEESELKYYQMNDFTISGYYTKNEKKYPFYVFETNFHDLNLTYKEYDSESGEIETKEYNLYNKKGSNSLHEATNVLLRNDNTLSKQYCKWVNYDNENYYTNNNISYSTIYGKYGTFPIFKNLTESNLRLKVDLHDGKLNAYVPVGDYEYYQKFYSRDNECVIYNNMILNNISTWFEMWNDGSTHIFDEIEKWNKISKFNNSCFYKGIIYQNLPEDTDYFAVLLKLQQNDISGSKISNLTITIPDIDVVAKYEDIASYDFYNHNKAYIDVNTFIQQVNSIDEFDEDAQYYTFRSEDNELYIKYDYIKNLTVYDGKSFEDYFIGSSSNPIANQITHVINSYEILDNVSFNNIRKYYEAVQGLGDNLFNDTFKNIYYLDIYTGDRNKIVELLKENNKDTLNEYSNNDISKIFKKDEFIYVPKKEQIYKIIMHYVDKISDTNMPVNSLDYLDFEYLKYDETISADYINTQITKFINEFADAHTFTNDNAISINKIKNYLILYKFFYLNYKLNVTNSLDLENAQLYYYVIDNSISLTLTVDFFRAYENSNYNGYKVYVDSYNLHNIIPNIDNVELITTNEYYCKFLDLNHLKEYCRHLNGNDSSSNVVVLTQKEIFDTLYCKRTCVVSQETQNEYSFKLVNKVSSLKNKIYENDEVPETIIEDILDNVTYNSMLDEFIININGKITRCELFYKKELVELTDTVKNILEQISPDNTDLTKYMTYYMYYYSANIGSIYKHSFDITNTSESYENEVDETSLLYPIFESIYLNYDQGENFVETNKRFFDLLSEDNLYSRYSSTISSYIISDFNDDLINAGKLYKKINVNFAEVEDTKDEDGNDIKIHTYTHPLTGKKYCYFLINEYLANNTTSYNIFSVVYDKMTLDTINDKEFNANMFLDIYPFVKNDIFLDVSQQIKDWIVYPTHVKLQNIYKSVFLNNENNTNIVQNNQTQYLYLNRYFGNIMPAFKMVDNIVPDMYKRIYKVKKYNFVNENKLVSYVKNSCNIYKNQPIYYVRNYKELASNNFNEFIPYENKHFMDNLLYHLPATIEFSTPITETISYNDIAKYEDVSDIETSKIFEYFKNYIKIKYYKTFDVKVEEDKETLLFLFKMYSYIIEKNVIKYDIKLNNKLYSITYKLSLK